MNNNPVKYTDPTGHDPKGPGYCYEPDDPGCGGSKKQPPKPPIVPRSKWGAMEPGYHTVCALGNCATTGWDEGYYDPGTNRGGYARYSDLYPEKTLAQVLDMAVIHHEGDTQDYNVNVIQRGHMFGEGWTDIGYHYVIGPDGTIYEGRDVGVRGTHVIRQNSGKIGVLLLGDFEPGMELGLFKLPFDLWNGDDLGPTSQQINSTMALLGWLDYLYGIESVVGHRDVPGQDTSCPGAYLMPYIPQLDEKVKEH
jgi:hypothetical protein